MRPLFHLFCGLLFGAGLIVSGMADPAKVLNFLDIAGSWDPSLMFVMGGAAGVALIGYRFAWRRPAPLFDSRFHLPESVRIDAPLLGGAALFGLGWGLSGFCPGPALLSLPAGAEGALMFGCAMALGMAAAKLATREREKRLAASAAVETA
jgi:uncharacterized protein